MQCSNYRCAFLYFNLKIGNRYFLNKKAKILRTSFYTIYFLQMYIYKNTRQWQKIEICLYETLALIHSPAQSSDSFSI